MKKYALVTGSTRGIGKEIGRQLLEKGYHVIFHYGSDERQAELLREEFSDQPGFLDVWMQDMSKTEKMKDIRVRVEEMGGVLDVLVLNASTSDYSKFGNIRQEDWERVMNVNLNSPFFLVQELAPYIRDGGSIIFISSIHGKYPHGSSISYAVSKAAVLQLSRCLVKEFASRHITVNSILPGYVDTEWQRKKTVERQQLLQEKNAARRFGRPEEIARLCMEVIENRFINGSLLSIDGGYYTDKEHG